MILPVQPDRQKSRSVMMKNSQTDSEAMAVPYRGTEKARSKTRQAEMGVLDELTRLETQH